MSYKTTGHPEALDASRFCSPEEKQRFFLQGNKNLEKYGEIISFLDRGGFVVSSVALQETPAPHLQHKMPREWPVLQDLQVSLLGMQTDERSFILYFAH